MIGSDRFYINGQYVKLIESQLMAVFNPVNEQVMGQIVQSVSHWLVRCGSDNDFECLHNSINMLWLDNQRWRHANGVTNAS